MTKDQLRNIIREAVEGIIEEGSSDYQTFVKKVMDRFGVDRIDAMSDEKKKRFFDYLDKNWNADNETDVDESLEEERRQFTPTKSDKIAYVGYDTKSKLWWFKTKTGRKAQTFKSKDTMEKVLKKIGGLDGNVIATIGKLNESLNENQRLLDKIGDKLAQLELKGKENTPEYKALEKKWKELDAKFGEGVVNEVEYRDALDKFNKDLERNSQVQKIAKFHNRSIGDVVKALYPYLKVLRYSDKSIKKVFISFTDTNSNIKVDMSHSYKRNESAVNEYSRPYTSRSGDPKWIRAKYAGTAEDGTPFKKGEQVLFWPRGGKNGKNAIMVGKQADKEWREFQSNAADEEWMAGQFGSGMVREGVTASDLSTIKPREIVLLASKKTKNTQISLWLDMDERGKFEQIVRHGIEILKQGSEDSLKSYTLKTVKDELADYVLYYALEAAIKNAKKELPSKKPSLNEAIDRVAKEVANDYGFQDNQIVKSGSDSKGWSFIIVKGVAPKLNGKAIKGNFHVIEYMRNGSNSEMSSFPSMDKAESSVKNYDTINEYLSEGESAIPNRSKSTIDKNKKLKIVQLTKSQVFTDKGGDYTKAGWAFELPGSGFVKFKSDNGPYIPAGGKNALQSILDQGGFLDYDSIEFVKPK